MTIGEGGVPSRTDVAARADDGAGVSAKLPSGSPIGEVEQPIGVVPPELPLPLPVWLAPLAICCVVAFVPWIVYLGVTLPRRSRTNHYDVAERIRERAYERLRLRWQLAVDQTRQGVSAPPGPPPTR